MVDHSADDVFGDFADAVLERLSERVAERLSSEQISRLPAFAHQQSSHRARATEASHLASHLTQPFADRVELPLEHVEI
jgi:hypothetical protein